MDNKLKNKLIIIFGIIAMVCLVTVGILINMLIKANREIPKENFDSVAISEKISKISELAVQRLEYRDIVKYTDGNIPFLTQKGCNMVYSGYAKIGIDLKKAEIKVSEKSIDIALPEAEILEVVIDEHSLEFYDEKFALFNWQDRVDTVQLIKFAKNNINEKAKKSDSFLNAKAETAKILYSFLEPLNDSRDETEKITINIY